LCLQFNSFVIVFELTYDAIMHKIRAASDLQHNVWYVQTDDKYFVQQLH